MKISILGPVFAAAALTFLTACASPTSPSSPGSAYTESVSGASPTNGYVTGGPVPTFSWTAPTGVDHYEIQIASSASAVSNAAVTTTTSTQYVYPGTLTAGTTMYWRVRPVDSANNKGSWTATSSLTYKTYNIGDTGPAGGVVFYDQGSYTNGWRYLEAAPSDQTTSAGTPRDWTNSDAIPAQGTAVGTGKANTSVTVNAFGLNPPYMYAALLAHQLTLGGQNDWFLPSEGELNAMYAERNVIGNFVTTAELATAFYWSSTDLGYNGYTRSLGFDSDSWGDGNNGEYSVRACREF